MTENETKATETEEATGKLEDAVRRCGDDPMNSEALEALRLRIAREIDKAAGNPSTVSSLTSRLLECDKRMKACRGRNGKYRLR